VCRIATHAGLTSSAKKLVNRLALATGRRG
jgi:hypothetical protein